jgi:uncharacterized secreted protein with C-terminal beta-propeller domain
MPSSRQGLLDAGADRILFKISQTENPKLKANCSRSLKNLSSDATETIEEGAVAALIAMSLEVRPSPSHSSLLIFSSLRVNQVTRTLKILRSQIFPRFGIYLLEI